MRRRYRAAGHERRLELGARRQRYAARDPCRESLDAVHEVGAEILHLASVLDKLPKRLQGRAKKALHEIMDAETRADAERAASEFDAEYGAKYEKAVASLRRDFEKLLTFYDFPAEHWKHLRSTNIIESPFATARLRQRITKGPGSRTKAIPMAFKLLEMAGQRWRRINGPELLPLVAHGVKFQGGVQTESKEDRAA